MYVHICQGKTHVYVLKHYQVKDKAKKLIIKMKIGCQEIKRQECWIHLPHLEGGGGGGGGGGVNECGDLFPKTSLLQKTH
jgi:hypothetical protein